MHRLDFSADPPADLVRAQVARICQTMLSDSHAQQNLLRVLVDATLKGAHDQLTRARIFENWRGEAVSNEETISGYRTRLQGSLDRYYLSPSPGDFVKISLSPRSFVPSIQWLKRDVPIVGRNAEIRRFREFCDAAPNSPRVVFIAGASGVGKTTLGNLLLDQLKAASTIRYDVRVAGPDDPRSAGPYLPFDDALRSLVTKLSKRQLQAFQRLAPSWQSAVKGRKSDTGSILRPLPSELDEFLRQISAEGGIGLFLDNVHLADGATARVVSELARAGTGRVFLAVAYREGAERYADHPIRRTAAEVDIAGNGLYLNPQPLDRFDVGRFVDQTFLGHVFPPQLIHELHASCAGLPLDLVELCRQLRESGDFAVSDGHWRLSRCIDDVASSLPHSRTRLADAILTGLSEQDVALLSAAALIGEAFESDILAAVLVESTALVESELHSLAGRTGFIEFSSRGVKRVPAAARYRFSHSAYHDRLYAQLDPFPTKRREWALRAFSAIESAANGAPGLYAARLAVLAETGGQFEKAAKYYCEGAADAAMSYAYGSAIRLCRAGMDLVNSEIMVLDRDSIRNLVIRFDITLGGSLLSANGFASKEALETFERLLEESTLVNDSEGLLMGLFGNWVCLFTMGKLKKSLEIAERLMEATGKEVLKERQVEAAYQKGTSLLHMGRLQEAYACLSDARRKAIERDGDKRKPILFWNMTAVCRTQLARVLWLLGRIDEAESMADEALELANSMIEPQQRALALVTCAELAYLNRRWDAALDLSEKALAMSLDSGASEEFAFAKFFHASAMCQSEKLHEGLEEFQASFAFYRTSLAEVGLTEFRCFEAEALIRSGSIVDAEKSLSAALFHLRKNGETYFKPEIHRLQAEALARRNEPGSASTIRELLLEGLEFARRGGSRSFHLRLALSWHRLSDTLDLLRGERYRFLEQSLKDFPEASQSNDGQKALGILSNRKSRAVSVG